MRSLLDNSSQVKSPYLQSNIDKIDFVQRHACH